MVGPDIRPEAVGKCSSDGGMQTYYTNEPMLN